MHGNLDYFVPYGYRFDATQGVVPVPEQQAVIADIMSRRERGWSLKNIAWALNEHGAPTKRGGARWYASTVRSVILTVMKHRQCVA